MINKIRCLFEKINKFFHSEQFLDDVLPLITVAVVIFSVVFCLLLSPLSALAYADYPYSVTLTNPNSLPFNGDVILEYYNNGYQAVDAFGTHTITQAVDNTVCTVTNSRTEDGTSIFDISTDGVTVECIGDIPNGTYCVDYIFLIVDPSISIQPSSIQFAGVGILENTVDGDVGLYFLLNVDNNFNVEEVGFNFGVMQRYIILRPIDDVPPTQCPSLEEQISNYNGSWTDFLMMLRQNNRTLANSYQNNIDLAIQSGFQSGANSVTLEQRLSEFDGDWQDFERLMAEYNVDLQTMYTYYVNSLETQAFEDGKAYGQEIGYKNGYNSGLNKGQSDTFTKNFFSDFIGGVIDVVDSIHFYEEYDSNGELTFYLSPWSIVIVVLMVAIVIIFLKVFRGG